MAPSAPLPLPPPAPLTAFLEGDGTVHPCNGNDSPTEDIPPVIVNQQQHQEQQQQPKLPGKSNLKRHSMFGSPQHHLILQSAPIRHSRSLSGSPNNFGLTVSKEAPPIAEGEEQEESPPKAAAAAPAAPVVGNGVHVVSTEDYIQYKRKDSRVTWTDNHGKDLAEVWEYEPSDTNDSDEESDCDSSQACSCVIQ
ncbi:unnamed protein product [Calypogeia fissa]